MFFCIISQTCCPAPSSVCQFAAGFPLSSIFQFCLLLICFSSAHSFPSVFLFFVFRDVFYLFFVVLGWGMTCPHLKLIGFLCFAFCFYSFCFPQSFPSVFLFFAFRDFFWLVHPFFGWGMTCLHKNWSDFCVLPSVSIPSVFPTIFSFCFLVFRFSWWFFALFFLFLGEVWPVRI